MDARLWDKQLRAAPNLDDLVDRLVDPPSAVAFMIGSALSAPERDGDPGVPGVKDMVTLARALVENRRPRVVALFDEALKGKDDSERYAAAFLFLRNRLGQRAVNEVVRAASLRARKPGAKVFDTDQALEGDLGGWHLSRGTAALGELLASFPESFPGPVLTTNFDPLVSIAVEAAGKRARRAVISMDRDPPSLAELGGEERLIIHLHGYWRDSDTMHTPGQLAARRERLEDWCERALQRRLLVVVGYGGWDDEFTRMMSRLLDPARTQLEIAWAFYPLGPNNIIGSHAVLLESFERWLPSGRFQPYVGIDGHELLGRVLDETKRLSPPTGSPPIAGRAGLDSASVSRAPTTSRRPSLTIAVDNTGSEPDVVGPDDDQPTAEHLEPQQRTLLQSLVDRLNWLLYDTGHTEPGRPSAVASMALYRMSKLESLLGDLEAVRPDEWPDTDWALELGDARETAEDAFNRVNDALKGRSEAFLDDGIDIYGELIQELGSSLRDIHDLILRNYPQLQRRH